MDYEPRLRKDYREKVTKKLMEKFQYTSVMQVPKLQKICLNQGVGRAILDKKILDTAVEEMTMIAGQKAVITYAKKSISNFKLREGMPIGTRVTLRGNMMWEFLDRLVAVTLPRVRDFRGLAEKSFDGRGNYSLGITEQIVFQEIDLDNISAISGLDITFTTSAKTDKEAHSLLSELGVPFQNKNN